MPPSGLGATVLHGRTAVRRQQGVVLPRSKDVMGSGTVLRLERMKRVAGAAALNSLPVEGRARGQWLPVTLLAGQYVTQSQRDATISCTVLMAAMRETALSVSQGPSIVTVTGVCLRAGAVMARWTVRMGQMSSTAPSPCPARSSPRQQWGAWSVGCC